MVSEPLRWALQPSIIVVLLTVNACSADAEDKLTVCELFGDLQSHTGRVILLTGQLVTGRHVFALAAPDCGRKFLAGGLHWPTAIHLAESTEFLREERSVSFSLDQRSRKVFEAVKAMVDQFGPGASVTATIEGELRTRDTYRRGKGFGHMGIYPAALVMRSIQSVQVDFSYDKH